MNLIIGIIELVLLVKVILTIHEFISACDDPNKTGLPFKERLEYYVMKKRKF